MLGWSAGGLIAFEIARKLVEAGEPEPRLLLLDAAMPNGFVGYNWGESILYPDKVISNLRHFAGRVLRPGHSAGPGPRIPPHAEDLLILNEKNLQAIAIAVKTFKARSYFGSLTIMRTRQGRLMAFGRWHLGWRAATRGTISVIDVPGVHLDMLEPPHVGTVTRKLADWLARG